MVEPVSVEMVDLALATIEDLQLSKHPSLAVQRRVGQPEHQSRIRTWHPHRNFPLDSAPAVCAYV